MGPACIYKIYNIYVVKRIRIFLFKITRLLYFFVSFLCFSNFLKKYERFNFLTSTPYLIIIITVSYFPFILQKSVTILYIFVIISHV